MKDDCLAKSLCRLCVLCKLPFVFAMRARYTFASAKQIKLERPGGGGCLGNNEVEKMLSKSNENYSSVWVICTKHYVNTCLSLVDTPRDYSHQADQTTQTTYT